MKKFTESMIATYKEMADNGLIDIELLDPRDYNTLILWEKNKETASNKWRYSSIIECTEEREEKSTHVLSDYYFAFPQSDRDDVEYAFLDYCEKITGERALLL